MNAILPFNRSTDEFIFSAVQAAETLDLLTLASQLSAVPANSEFTVRGYFDNDDTVLQMSKFQVRMLPKTLRPTVFEPVSQVPIEIQRMAYPHNVTWEPVDDAQLGAGLTAEFVVTSTPSVRQTIPPDPSPLGWPVRVQREGAREISWLWYNQTTQTLDTPAQTFASSRSAEPVVLSDEANTLVVGDRFELLALPPPAYVGDFEPVHAQRFANKPFMFYYDVTEALKREPAALVNGARHNYFGQRSPSKREIILMLLDFPWRPLADAQRANQIARFRNGVRTREQLVQRWRLAMTNAQ